MWVEKTKTRAVIVIVGLLVAVGACSSSSDEPVGGGFAATPTTTEQSTTTVPRAPSSTSLIEPPPTEAPTTTRVAPSTTEPGGFSPPQLADPAQVDRSDPVAVAEAAVCNYYALFAGETSQQVADRIAPVVTPELAADIAQRRLGNQGPQVHYDVVPMGVEHYPGSDGTPGYYVWCGIAGFNGPGTTGVFLQNPKAQMIAVMAEQPDGTWLVSRYVQTDLNLDPPA